MDSPNKWQKYKKYKSTQNSVIFRATDSRFCMEVHMHRPTIWESTKVQKVQKVQKYKKYKSTKSTKVQKYKSTKIQKYKIKKFKNTKTWT